MANNKVQLRDGTVLLDLTGDTVTPEALAAGVTAHDAKGDSIVGTATASGVVSYYKKFASSEWAQTDVEATMSIPRNEHGISGVDVFAQVSILANKSYRKGTWASLETYAMITADGTITLRTSSAFDGAVLLIG